MAKEIKVGIVGAAGRGAGYFSAFEHNPHAALVALCDIRPDALSESIAQAGIGDTCEIYSDYEQMIENAGLDAVVVSTPIQFHVPQAIMALGRGIHVLSEVPAAFDIDQCKQLVDAVKKSKAKYMMAENCCYFRDNVLVHEIVKAGLLGETYYGEGEYVHEVKELFVITPWRRIYGAGVRGNTYPTHSLGPVYQWFGEQRVTSVCCFGSGHHYKDVQGKFYENEDTTTTACRLENGGLINLRLDMFSNRPAIGNYWCIQGTKGCYESSRGFVDRPKIHLTDRHEMGVWIDLEELAEEFLPDKWLNMSDEAKSAGHFGSDYMQTLDFVESLINDKKPPIGIHEALDMTLPGIISRQSISQGSIWLDVPDSRDW